MMHGACNLSTSNTFRAVQICFLSIWPTEVFSLVILGFIQTVSIVVFMILSAPPYTGQTETWLALTASVRKIALTQLCYAIRDTKMKKSITNSVRNMEGAQRVNYKPTQNSWLIRYFFYVARHSKHAMKLHILQLNTSYVKFSYLTCLLHTLPNLLTLLWSNNNIQS